MDALGYWKQREQTSTEALAWFLKRRKDFTGLRARSMREQALDAVSGIRCARAAQAKVIAKRKEVQ